MADNQNRKKGGRPKKSPVALKSKTIGVCFSEPELYTIKYRADRAGLPLSIYCHDAVLNALIIESVKKEDLELLKEISAIGNNLNQLTKLAHNQGAFSLESAIRMVLKYILKIINKLSHDWKNSKRKKL